MDALAAPLLARADEQARLLARLDRLTQDDTTPRPWLCVRALRAHAIKSATLDHPGMAIPIRGTKRLMGEDPPLQATPGELLLFTGPLTADMEHLPEAASGDYRALGMSFVPEVLDAARTLWASPPRAPASGQPRAHRLPLAPLLPALHAWQDALDAGREAAMRHALAGLVLALCEQGHDSLLLPLAPTLAARIRAMVAAQPQRDWRSEHFEQVLGLSGATLRRRLAADGSSLRQLVADARLAQALSLLYSTALPVKTVAQRVGYASTSSFVKRFGERFGVEPSRIADTPLG